MNKESILKVTETLIGVIFAVTYWLYDLHVATIVLIAGMTAFVIAVKLMGQKLTKLQLITWLLVLIMGGATVWSKNENFIKWKPTILYLSIGLAFFISQFFKQSLLERLIADKVPAPAKSLRKVNFAAFVFFLFLAGLNIFVAQNFSTDVWMKFKLFGIFGLNLVFVVGCFYYLRPYLHNLFPPESK